MDGFTNSRSGVSLAAAVARIVPPRLGHSLTKLVAQRLAANKRSPRAQAVRANQWVARGEQISAEGLDRAVQDTFCNSARAIYDLYHYIQHPRQAERIIVFEESAGPLIDRPELDRRGLVVVGLHLCGFDLGLQWICLRWAKPLVLTLPNPHGTQQAEFDFRRRTGMNLQTASVASLRQGVRYLKQGGMVATGIDYPLAAYEPRPLFFGRPACLPTHHISLALLSQSPVILAASRLEADGRYYISASPLIEMDAYPDRNEELCRNAEKVLAYGEDFIRRAPQQWLAFQPVWPEALQQTPGNPPPGEPTEQESAA